MDSMVIIELPSTVLFQWPTVAYIACLHATIRKCVFLCQLSWIQAPKHPIITTALFLSWFAHAPHSCTLTIAGRVEPQKNMVSDILRAVFLRTWSIVTEVYWNKAMRNMGETIITQPSCSQERPT